MNVTYMNMAVLFNTTVTSSGYYSGSHHFSGFITGDIQSSVRQIFDIILKSGVCVFGTVANVINIVIFAEIGLSDGIIVSFFGLAIADLGFVFFTFLYQLSSTLDNVVDWQPYVDLGSLTFVLNMYSFLFVDISTLVTVFAAVQKCACVAIPLMFKNIFTRSKAILVVLLIYIVMIIYYIPLLVGNQLKPSFDEAYNRTRMKLYHPSIYDPAMDIFQIFNRICIPFCAQVFVIVSTIVLIVKLRQASIKRRSMTNESNKDTNDDTAKGDNNALSPKEKRAVLSVTVISAVFVACNLPDVVSTLFVEMSANYDYGVYRLMRAVQNSLAAINSSINIFVYLTFNLKFRERFLTGCGHFCCCRGEYNMKRQ